MGRRRSGTARKTPALKPSEYVRRNFAITTSGLEECAAVAHGNAERIFRIAAA